MPYLPPELMELLARLTPEQQQSFIALKQSVPDRGSFVRELTKHPELLAALQQPTGKEKDAESWAALHNELGSGLAHNPQGPRAENFEQAIAHYQKSLDVHTRQAYPEEWARAQIRLGNAYGDRDRGDRAENLEKAIAHYLQALEVYTVQVYPERWATTQYNLALVYRKRICGERAGNLEQAITRFEQALQVYTRQSHPEDWAGTELNLGEAYRHRVCGNRADNLEQAISHYKQALGVFTRQAYPEDWAMTHLNLAEAYAQRIRGERADNLEQAIIYGEQALEVYTRQDYPEQWALTHHNLGATYRPRIRGERADNLELAIAHYEQVLEVYTRQAYPEDWALTQNNLALAYLDRVRGERADNLEQSIAHTTQALEVYTRQAYPERWAVTQHNLALAYSLRVHGERADNIEQSIAHYKQALEVRTSQAFPADWAMSQYNLAIAYSYRIHGERSENVKLAITHYQQALKVRTLEAFPTDYQDTQCNLGHLYFLEKRWSEALVAYQESIRAEHVLLAAAYTQAGRWSETARTAGIYSLAAYALLRLGRVGEALVQLEQGKTRLLSKALALNEVDLSILPAAHQESLRNLRQAIRALEAEMRLPPDTPARRDDRTLAQALEQARAELNETIKTVRKAHLDFMPEGLELAEILALIPKDAALVVPVISSQGGAVLVVPAGMQSVSLDQVLWLEDFKEADLRALLLGPAEQTQSGGWLGAYFNARTNTKLWLDTIEATAQTLWDRLMGPTAERLEGLGVRHILLMPQGRSGLLPLHAAWREVDGGRRYFLDDYTVCYMPSARARRVSEGRLPNAARKTRTLFVVVNPTEDLPFTPAEGEQVASLFGDNNSTVLLGNKATSDAVKQGAASYLHFACHGFYNWRDAMQSGLVLAKGETLTLAQIIGQLNLEANRLVTLSACETGITEISQSPDEYLGLPAGFFQAGAPAVVSTLWAVNDRSTMLLMERFYQLHLKDGLDIPDALRQAQVWLREVTVGELEQRFAHEEDEALRVHTGISIQTASDYFAYFASLAIKHGKTYQPFAHPYYWAAFTFSGA